MRIRKSEMKGRRRGPKNKVKETGKTNPIAEK